MLMLQDKEVSTTQDPIVLYLLSRLHTNTQYEINSHEKTQLGTLIISAFLNRNCGLTAKEATDLLLNSVGNVLNDISMMISVIYPGRYDVDLSEYSSASEASVDADPGTEGVENVD
jgi:hypothetical protein